MDLTVAIAMLAQASGAPASAPAVERPTAERALYGPAAPAAPQPAVTPTPAAAEEKCETPRPDALTREIVVCAQRPQGYRLNPDVMAAKRAKRGVSKPRPAERPKGAPGLCENIGGCTGMESIDWVSVGLVAARMAAKAANGENVGKMFVTDPQPTEYQLYLEAKRAREAEEADKAAEAVKTKAQATAKAQSEAK